MFEPGQSTTETVLGKKYTFSRLEHALLMEWREWLVESVGDPVADLVTPIFDKLPPEEQMRLYREAKSIKEQLARHKFQFTCPLSLEALQTTGGQAKFGVLMLRDHHPDITENEAWRVLLALGPKLETIIKRAIGKMPSGNGLAPVPSGEPGEAVGTGSKSTES